MFWRFACFRPSAIGCHAAKAGEVLHCRRRSGTLASTHLEAPQTARAKLPTLCQTRVIFRVFKRTSCIPHLKGPIPPKERSRWGSISAALIDAANDSEEDDEAEPVQQGPSRWGSVSAALAGDDEDSAEVHAEVEEEEAQVPGDVNEVEEGAPQENVVLWPKTGEGFFLAGSDCPARSSARAIILSGPLVFRWRLASGSRRIAACSGGAPRVASG